MIEYTVLNKLYFNECFSDAVFNCNGIGIPNTDLNNINLDEKFDEDDPDTIILMRHLAQHIKFRKRK